MKTFLILIILSVFIISLLLLILIISYINPFTSNNIIIYSFLLSLFLFISTFFTLILFFIKKIHYRWQVVINHISSSFRQASLIAVFFILLGFFEKIGVPIYFSSLLLFILLLFFELFIQNIYS